MGRPAPTESAATTLARLNKHGFYDTNIKDLVPSDFHFKEESERDEIIAQLMKENKITFEYVGEKIINLKTGHNNHYVL